MEFTLTISTLIGLFISLAVLAAIPSTSVFLVSSRSATYGFKHGVMTVLGIVLVDILFISIALYGMTLIMPWLGKWGVFVRLLAVAYLVWLVWRLWRLPELKKANAENDYSASLTSSFLLGMVITLADHKAILFYIGFFPAWMDVRLLTLNDTIIIFLITLLAVGSVKISYAYLAAKTAKGYLASKLPQFNKLAAILITVIAVMMLISFLYD